MYLYRFELTFLPTAYLNVFSLYTEKKKPSIQKSGTRNAISWEWSLGLAA